MTIGVFVLGEIAGAVACLAFALLMVYVGDRLGVVIGDYYETITLRFASVVAIIGCALAASTAPTLAAAMVAGLFVRPW